MTRADRGFADRLEKLAVIREAVVLMIDEHATYARRLGEMLDGGFASANGDGSRGGSTAKPVEAQIGPDGRRRPDPVRRLNRDVEASVDRLYTEARRALALWGDIARRRHGGGVVEDPGCELCARVPANWSAVYCHAELQVVERGQESTRRMPVCFWCYQFERRVSRWPNQSELERHARGQRVRVRAG